MADRYIIFYDFDCGFCQSTMNWITKGLSINLQTIPYQNKNKIKEYPMLNPSIIDKEVQLIKNDEIYSGAEAIGICLKFKNNILYKFIGNIIVFPLILPFSKICYKMISNNRNYISKFFKMKVCKLN